MGRLLFFLLIAIAIYLLWRGIVRAQQKREAAEQREAQAPARAEDMVACARCGVNLPRSEAANEAGRLVCANNPHCHAPR